MFGSRVLTTRRTALAIVASTPFVLTSCDLDPRSSDALPSPAPVADVDAAVVASARAAIVEMSAFLAATSRQHRPLRSQVTALRAMHAAHLEVLDDGSDVEPGSQQTLPPSGLPEARVQIRSREAALAVSLVEAARRAESGDLARALASMSAAVGQRVQV